MCREPVSLARFVLEGVLGVAFFPYFDISEQKNHDVMYQIRGKVFIRVSKHLKIGKLRQVFHLTYRCFEIG